MKSRRKFLKIENVTRIGFLNQEDYPITVFLSKSRLNGVDFVSSMSTFRGYDIDKTPPIPILSIR